MRNASCVATGDPPFFINSSTTKARCSPDHAMVYTENGTYTAVLRCAPYPKLCPSQIGEFFLPDPVLTTEQLVPEPCAFQYEIAIEKLMGNKSPSTDQIPVEMIKEGNTTIHFEIHKLITSIWNEEELPEEWKVSINVPIYKMGDKTDRCNYRGISLLSRTHKNFYPTSCCQS